MTGSLKLGNKSFYCGGKVVFGTETLQVWFTFITLTIPPLYFSWMNFGIDSIKSFDTNAMIFLGNLLLTIIFFWINVLCDPGIVARDPTQPKASSLEIKTVEFRDKTYTLKYCMKCKFHRPLRTHHCKVCEVCVEHLGKQKWVSCINEIDHHCPWLGTCIGRRNRGTFILFLIFTAYLCWNVLSNNIYRLNVISDLNGDVLTVVCCWFFLAYAGVIGLFVILLLLLQFVMIARGLTTLELLRNYWKGMINPYNRGCLMNCIEGLCLTDRSSRSITIQQVRMLQEQEYELSTASSLDTSTNKNSLITSLV